MSRIPKTLHYVFGMSPSFGGKPWSLIHHVCLSSAVERIKPDKVLFYYSYEPTGAWWRASRNMVTLVKIEAPEEVFGNKLHHVAHKADVIRLRTLIEHGGIYLDADVLVQRSFDDLLHNSTVLGQENAGDGLGLANAIILAEPQSPFLVRWFDEYRTFDGDRWNEHSVKLPARLAAAHPGDITVLPPNAFYWPTWQDDGLAQLFTNTKPVSMEGTYANHLWESLAWPYVKEMTPGDVREGGSNFKTWAAPFVATLPDRYGAPGLLERATRAGKRQLRLVRDKLGA